MRQHSYLWWMMDWLIEHDTTEWLVDRSHYRHWELMWLWSLFVAHLECGFIIMNHCLPTMALLSSIIYQVSYSTTNCDQFELCCIPRIFGMRDLTTGPVLRMCHRHLFHLSHHLWHFCRDLLDLLVCKWANTVLYKMVLCVRPQCRQLLSKMKAISFLKRIYWYLWIVLTSHPPHSFLFVWVLWATAFFFVKEKWRWQQSERSG